MRIKLKNMTATGNDSYYFYVEHSAVIPEAIYLATGTLVTHTDLDSARALRAALDTIIAEAESAQPVEVTVKVPRNRVESLKSAVIGLSGEVVG